jgi:hypothetical protein
MVRRDLVEGHYNLKLDSRNGLKLVAQGQTQRNFGWFSKLFFRAHLKESRNGALQKESDTIYWCATPHLPISPVSIMASASVYKELAISLLPGTP